MKRLIAALSVCGCGTTLNANNYAQDCDADLQCVRVIVGDICGCSCDLAAINERDYNKYYADLQRVGACRPTCIDGGDDASFQCGLGIAAQCSAGMCITYALPTDAQAE
jgi:hypothetical protein